MAKVTFKGGPLSTVGELPKIGASLPNFKLTKADLGDVSQADYKGKTLILNIVPSLDTGTCAASAKAFNKKIKELGNVIVLTISRDLPFAQKRFCDAEGIDSVITLSALRNMDFGNAYGVTIADGPLAGLFSRAVVVADPAGKIVYTEQVQEIANEPNYDGALKAAKLANSGY
ncbi:thiol peroxidase [Spirochaetota bacterium]